MREGDLNLLPGIHTNRRSRALAVLVTISILGPALFAGNTAKRVFAAPARQTPQQLKIGPVAVMAIDNNGSGWAWTGPANERDNGHLLRLQNGAWADVPRSDAAGGGMGRTAAAGDAIVLAGGGESGWGPGTGGGGGAWGVLEGGGGG